MKKFKQNKLKYILGIIALVLMILVGAFFWYVSDYYKADAIALNVLSQDNIVQKDNITVLSPDTPSDTAMIFYPGAKVEAEAYLPLLDKIRDDTHITCILVDMPFHLAIFDTNAAKDIISEFPDIQNWYMAGHSMRGAMASQFASKNEKEIKGLILMGTYIYGNYPLAHTLTIYGTLDGLAAEDINYTTNTVPIEGGNHAQFGNYGQQKGDFPATITAKQQQEQTVKAIDAFINK